MKRVILVGVAFLCLCSSVLAQKPPPVDPSLELQLALAEVGALEVLVTLHLTPEQLAALGPMVDTLQHDQAPCRTDSFPSSGLCSPTLRPRKQHPPRMSNVRPSSERPSVTSRSWTPRSVPATHF
jgi:hypothetical protein